jgi:hypothetical protein
LATSLKRTGSRLTLIFIGIDSRIIIFFFLALLFLFMGWSLQDNFPRVLGLRHAKEKVWGLILEWLMVKGALMLTRNYTDGVHRWGLGKIKLSLFSGFLFPPEL